MSLKPLCFKIVLWVGIDCDFSLPLSFIDGGCDKADENREKRYFGGNASAFTQNIWAKFEKAYAKSAHTYTQTPTHTPINLIWNINVDIPKPNDKRWLPCNKFAFEKCNFRLKCQSLHDI